MDSSSIASQGSSTPMPTPDISPLTPTPEATTIPMPETAVRGWFDSMHQQLKDYLPGWAIDLVSFWLVFFIIGFLLKSFGRYLIYAILASAIIITILYYAKVVHIDLITIKYFVGMSGDSIKTAPTLFIEWAKNHPIAWISAIIGFLVGWKIG